MRVAESSDVPAMSHFKVPLKAHTVPRLLTGHKGDVCVGVSARFKERKTDREKESERKKISLGQERSRGILGIEKMSQRKRGPLKQMFI